MFDEENSDETRYMITFSNWNSLSSAYIWKNCKMFAFHGWNYIQLKNGFTNLYTGSTFVFNYYKTHSI